MVLLNAKISVFVRWQNVCCLKPGIDTKYWAEAGNTANYNYNILPGKFNEITPFELWFGKQPSVGHLKIIDDKANKYIFIIYADNCQAYRLSDFVTVKYLFRRTLNLMTKCLCAKSDKPRLNKLIDLSIPISTTMEESANIVNVLTSGIDGQRNASEEAIERR